MNDMDMSKIYVLIGSLVVMNIGTIGSIMWASIRLVWWLSSLNSTVKEQGKDINEAHKKIRTLEKRAMDH